MSFEQLSEKIANGRAKTIDTWLKGLIGETLGLHAYDLENNAHQKQLANILHRKGYILEQHQTANPSVTIFKLLKRKFARQPGYKVIGELKLEIKFN